MKRLLFCFEYFFFFVILFILQKPLFMLYHQKTFGEGVGINDYFSVMQHGLPLDFSMAAYICVIPFLLVSFSFFTQKYLRTIFVIYNIIVLFLVAVCFSIDLDIYSYWNIKLDTTPFVFLKSPQDAIASFDWNLVLRQILIISLLYTFLLFVLKKVFIPLFSQFRTDNKIFIISYLSLTAILIFPIRGGTSDANMNVGWVYFSKNMYLNHAATNPMWNLMDATFEKKVNFDQQYRFMAEEDAQNIAKSLLNQNNNSSLKVLKNDRPNILLIVLESFSAKMIEPLGGEKDVAPTLNQLAQEGILFSNFYANSFRTDRGLSCLLSGYPSQPKFSIMRQPKISNNLPNIGNKLSQAGYELGFYYGGDENFTNMRSYLVQANFLNIISDKDFNKKDFINPWGAPDHIVLNRLLTDINKRESEQPFFNVMLTLYSHEPFKVPMETVFSGSDKNNLYKNSVHYVDQSLGTFFAQAKQESWWDNTLVILVSDHSFSYPEGLPIYEPSRYQIPMIWTGGAITNHQIIKTIGSQCDLASTLLGQLNIPYNDFTFSKNLFDENQEKFAYYSFIHGMGMIDETGVFVTNLDGNNTIYENEKLEKKSQAYLQTIYNDLETKNSLK